MAVTSALCRFNSEVYYEERLFVRDRVDRQAIRGPTPFAGSGLFLVCVEHEGNEASAPEEVAVVDRVAGRSWELTGSRDGARTGSPPTGSSSSRRTTRTSPRFGGG